MSNIPNVSQIWHIVIHSLPRVEFQVIPEYPSFIHEHVMQSRRRPLQLPQILQPPVLVVCLLLLFFVIFIIVLLTLQLESRPDTGASDLVSHTKPIKCTINGSLDSSEDDLPLGVGGGGRRNEGTARGRWRNKGRRGGAVREGNGGHGRSGDGESNHFYVGFGLSIL